MRKFIPILRTFQNEMLLNRNLLKFYKFIEYSVFMGLPVDFRDQYIGKFVWFPMACIQFY